MTTDSIGNIKRQGESNPMMFIYIDEHGTPRHSSAINEVVTRDVWDSIKMIGDSFFSSYTDSEITEHNDEMWREINSRDRHAKSKRIAEKKAGSVYLVKESSQGHYKIGRTVNVKSRMKTFTVKLPFKVELSHSFPADDYITAERLLHENFTHRHVDGEWFSLTEGDVEWIKEILEFNGGLFVRAV